ncbi:uncharacterized protein LOC9646500 [Selaginella moellendorffii]|uniref:uncharacterized protein LOC9646500 n=1 Tax=Selaginella moellendorffii TaxID=88036 RepID=UPI000D1CB3CA|nr:uncharacterized protein LOC9646500 [Selaginella moellendorffii]|eukprot:XP_024522402.1 uncharacterized protein LOC9646500 [Selaginella moellendorffii]
MEAVIVEPPQDATSRIVCLPELGRVQERVVLCSLSGRKRCAPLFCTSRTSQVTPISTHGSHSSISGAVNIRMNEELRALVGSSDCRDEKLTRPSSLYRLKNASPPQSSSLPFYYHKERLTTADTYLIVASRHLNYHMDSDFTSVFTTRIDALGLEEACRQIADVGSDDCRTFAVVPVGELLRQKVANGVTQEVSGQLHSAAEDIEENPVDINPEPADESESEDEDVPEDPDESEDEQAMELYDVRPDGFLPLVNGNPQVPEPFTSCKPGPPRDPCIRVMDLKEKDLKLVCKVGSCKFVIKNGDIKEWFVDGKNDAIVVPVGGQIHREICIATGSFTGLDIIPSGGLPAPKIIVIQGPKYYKDRDMEAAEYLGLTYRNAITLACKEGVKHIAFPAILCRYGGFPLDKVARIAVESVQKALKIAKVSIEVHFVIKDEPTWRHWVAATNLLAFKDYDRYVDAAMKLSENRKSDAFISGRTRKVMQEEVH